MAKYIAEEVGKDKDAKLAEKIPIKGFLQLFRCP
jgi:hypothetical protein